jgi:SAM-dependent methyltransferase
MDGMEHIGPGSGMMGTPVRTPITRTTASCRLCGTGLTETFADLGMSPLANSYRTAEQLRTPETFYPLHVFVCTECMLVQLEHVQAPEAIFSEYAYFSSFSDTWLEHCRAYVADSVGRLGLGDSSLVMEIASNDGYLLQYFKAAGIPVIGIEPAANVARAAIGRGIPTETTFFNAGTASELRARGYVADLVIANNVLAHVPDIHSFVEGLRIVLSPKGTLTVEFPHLLELIRHNQFDTIYHEHFSYLSLLVIERLFDEHGLTVFDVDHLPTHGGSLRIHATLKENRERLASVSLRRLRELEREQGLDRLETYKSFRTGLIETKLALWNFFLDCSRRGASVGAYGAPAKGNTLLNYCGIRRDLLPYTVDRSPHKQGLFLPGTQIPILPPDALSATKPDYVLILPWNLRAEIATQMEHVRSWGGKFVVPIPRVEIF